MRKLTYVLLISGFVVTSSTFAQSKKERKQDAKSLHTGMYDGTEDKEASVYYDQGAAEHVQGKYKEAIKFYKKAVKEDPKFVEAYDNMGVCYRRLGDFKNAIANYKKSIEIYPEGQMAHMNLGVIYNIQKKYDEAIKEYEIIQKLQPENPEGYYGTINPYMAKGDFKNAIKAATKTLEIYEATESPHLSDAQYLLGVCYYYNKENDKAKIYIKQAKDNGVKVPQQLLDELEIK